MKPKEIKDMSDKELIKELEGIENHIENFSYGRSELIYREQLYKEIEKRGIELQKNIKFSKVK